MDYNLKFKKEKDDKGYWNTSVFADTDEEAIQKAEEDMHKLKNFNEYCQWGELHIIGFELNKVYIKENEE